MTIIKNNPISMGELLEYTESEELTNFIKKFTDFNQKKAKELRQKLESLDLMKMSPDYLVKIIDLMPDNQEELNKIFTGANLDENESKKILDTIKNFK